VLLFETSLFSQRGLSRTLRFGSRPSRYWATQVLPEFEAGWWRMSSLAHELRHLWSPNCRIHYLRRSTNWRQPPYHPIRPRSFFSPCCSRLLKTSLFEPQNQRWLRDLQRLPGGSTTRRRWMSGLRSCWVLASDYWATAAQSSLQNQKIQATQFFCFSQENAWEHCTALKFFCALPLTVYCASWHLWPESSRTCCRPSCWASMSLAFELLFFGPQESCQVQWPRSETTW